MTPAHSSEEIRSAARDTVFEMVGRRVKDDAPLISSGLIDSLSILKLISRLESRLKISIPPANLQPDDFDSVDWITKTVIRVSRS